MHSRQVAFLAVQKGYVPYWHILPFQQYLQGQLQSMIRNEVQLHFLHRIAFPILLLSKVDILDVFLFLQRSLPLEL